MLHKNIKLLDRELFDRLNIIAEEVDVALLEFELLLADVEYHFWVCAIFEITRVLFDVHV